MEVAPCSICDSRTHFVRECEILGKYRGKLFNCPGCGYLFFQKPNWIREANMEAIASTDTGLLRRNERACRKTATLLTLAFGAGTNDKFLDFAGGYGLLVRGMRDIGMDFYWTDLYTENLLARGFENDRSVTAKAVTAYEVLEHSVDPVALVRSALAEGGGAGTLIFSTTLFTGEPPSPAWSYYSLETGQHVSFFQPRTLKAMAKRLGMNFHSHNGIHVFTNEDVSSVILKVALSRVGRFAMPVVHRRFKSLIEQDRLIAQGRIRSG